MFADLPQISALFCSISFCSSLPNLFCLNFPNSAFSLLTLSHLLQLSYFLQLSSILLHTLFFSHSIFVTLSPWILSYFIQTSFMVVCILLGIRNGQPCLFAFCLLNSFIRSFRKYNCRYQFNITVGFVLFRRLANASQQYKLKLFTFNYNENSISLIQPLG